MDYKNWYAVSVMSNKEKSAVAQLLERRAVLHDTFLEDVQYLQRKEIQVTKAGRKTVRNKLLMPGYVLVKVKPEVVEKEDGTRVSMFPPTTFDLITQTSGVTAFVNCDKQNPLPMRPREVKKMFDLCDDAHLEAKQNIESDFYVGDVLECIAGPFKGYNVEVANIQGDKVLGQIDMFGRSVPAEFTKFQLYKHDTARS